ncbi:hypothetical protein AUR64_10185 [Haloprofundus marisrubri]|uniref:Uncharacterized protein n=1 Tax=Haloprofundus marisrubri TaxID=1514971 RepID=A0A0W1RA63_9EURY|nr:hypothetical protein [Haloprofundus marisrubri]KTG09973.1 hypothetical protein AUR64_10185 [Haloprofundus marisrubri]
MADQSKPSERRNVEEGTEPHQEAEDTMAGARTTAPQSAYTTSQVGTGFVVLLVGLLVVFGIPLLLA